MRTTRRLFAVPILAATCLPGSAGSRHEAPAAMGRPAAGEAAECCFANPRYSGVCTVEPGEDETCASVLAYLNNPNSQGKTYCGNTSIRGGWKQVACVRARSSGPWSSSAGAPRP